MDRKKKSQKTTHHDKKDDRIISDIHGTRYFKVNCKKYNNFIN